jgi:hypothetical protein
MIGIYWRSIDPGPFEDAAHLVSLLDRVVTRRAKGLEVVDLPEQILVARVRFDMVDHRGRGEPPYLLAIPTQGL